MKDIMEKRHKYSLKKKTMLVMIAAFAIVGIASVFLFYKGALDIARAEYETHCTDLANTVARTLDISKVEAVQEEVMGIYRSLKPSECMTNDQKDEPGYEKYLMHYSHVKKMEEFISLRNLLRRSQDVAHVDCLFLIFPDMKTHRIIYLVDGAYKDVWEPGTLEVLYDTDFKVKGNIESGFGALISDTDEGTKLVTTAMPVFDNRNKIIAYAGLDYSIQSLLENQRNFVAVAALIIALLAAIAAFVVIRLVDRSIVKPINALSEASVRFYDQDDEGRHSFSDLDVHTGDEIETLADSMAKMEQDINDHIEALLSTRSELSDTKEYAEKMERNANKDSLTGVRNKRAYESAITDLNSDLLSIHAERFGIAVIDMNDLKLTNDTYGHECGDEAIKTMCGIICEVFKHSPVYRFGGDEFAVIMKGNDLRNIGALSERLHAEFRELKAAHADKPWLQVGAAIGHAVFDPSIDYNANSVFDRADKAMYEDKLRMKSDD